MKTTPLSDKSITKEIEARFDLDVERFSDLDTGQVATIDAPLAMELITKAAIAATPQITRVLDIGCGAGNNSIKLLNEYSSDFIGDLNDLSHPMLERTFQRISEISSQDVNLTQGDFRIQNYSEESYDVVLAAAVLHHLRDDADWEAAFSKIYNLLRPGGSFWITDMVSHESESVHELMWDRYGDYLRSVDGDDYRKKRTLQDPSPTSLN